MKDKKGNIGWAILSFFFPVVGIILYFLWKKERPGDAKMSLIGALIALVLILINIGQLIAVIAQLVG